MSYDLYVALGGESQNDANAIINGNLRNIKITDIATRIHLLVGIAARNKSVKDYAVIGGYKSLVHSTDPKTTPYAEKLITPACEQMKSLGLLPTASALTHLPRGSWFLRFTFTLAKPWMSKDDDPFYVAESVNPVRKDKVFKVPMMAASSWKGLMRWTMMHIHLVKQKNRLTPEQFAWERFAQALLFGDEKGEEPGETKDFAAFLDALKPEARAEYERLLREYYHVKPDEPLPRHSGRLLFYPTFFSAIDVEVINPHSRKTKAGTHPIYLECVPAGASGTFSLLYVPFDLIGQDEATIKQQVLADLLLVAEGLQAMFLTYGFSAKRTSGYGTARETVANGFFQIWIEETPAQPAVAPPPTTTVQSLPKYLQAPGKLKDEYLNPDGTFRERSQAELEKMSKSQLQEYEKAKKWWEREGKALAEQPSAPAETQTPADEAHQPTWLKREFTSFAQLVEEVKKLQPKEASHE